MNKIYFFLSATQSESKAKEIKKELVMLGYSLRTLPNRFPKEFLLEDLDMEFRSANIGNYKLVYHVGEGKVIILAVFDTRQDPGKIIEFF